MRNMGNMVGNVDELRNARDARKNPPTYEAGQGDDDGWDFLNDSPSDDISGGMMDDSAYMGSSGSSSFDSMRMDYQGMQTQQPTVDTSMEDKFFEFIMKAGKQLWKWGKDLFLGIQSGLKGNDAFYWTTYGNKLMLVGGIISIISVVLMILGLVTDYFFNSFWLLIGGILVAIIGLIIFANNFEKGKEIKGRMSSNTPITNSQDDFDIFNDDEECSEDDGWNWGNDEDDEVEEEDSLNFDVWNELENSADNSSTSSGVYEEDINIDSAMDNIREITPHTQTRQYLFEEYSKVLPLKNPDFAKLKSISENSDDFIIFDKILMDAAIQVGTKEDNLPELLELRENQFIIQLKSTRPSGLKEEDIANEIANIYSKDEFGGVIHEGVYATTSSVGSNYIINLFKGENSLVTLADTYKEVKDFVLDPKVKKPIVIGVNELGRVWKFDAEKVYSYIFSGKPRTGKSWGVVGLVVQLCMYSSPKEVIFEALDVKDTSSDFYKMNKMLPHFVNFEGNPQRILSRLRYLTTVEAERRKKILEAYDVINIADLKSRGEDIEIPYHYVIVDEMLGLKGKLNKDEDNEFKALINTIVTQMPNLGFRVILVPHRVTNDVIPKTTYTLVGCIACVKSDFKEINTTLEVSKKEFPYSLPNTGDMALKSSEINRGNTVFSHGIAITSTNEGNEDIYKFIGKLWNMLEPPKVEEKEEQYKGHSLEDDEEEDFWNGVLD